MSCLVQLINVYGGKKIRVKDLLHHAYIQMKGWAVRDGSGCQPLPLDGRGVCLGARGVLLDEAKGQRATGQRSRDSQLHPHQEVCL